MMEDVNVSKEGVHVSLTRSADGRSDGEFSTAPQPDSADAAVSAPRCYPVLSGVHAARGLSGKRLGVWIYPALSLPSLADLEMPTQGF